LQRRSKLWHLRRLEYGYSSIGVYVSRPMIGHFRFT
jgi:hypothetical protein